MLKHQVRLFLALLTLLSGMPAAHAQFAVIDVASLTQLISEVQTLGQQLETARNQLSQAQSEFHSITGVRGMEQLLAGVTRNYLPPDWQTLQSALGGSGAYPALSADLQTALRTASVLSPQQLGALSATAGAQLQAERQSVALQQSLSHEALANASNRFALLQELIDAIGRATDQKGILELQARISAEHAMLQDEHTKLQDLYQGVQAQVWANSQRARELSIAGHGLFDNRFRPHP
jgi:type IV secretion system protein VirB5